MIDLAPSAIDLSVLDTIALEINAIQRRVTRDLIHIGELFERARYLLPPGTFIQWCSDNFNLSADTIMNYRTVYSLSLQTPEIIDYPPTVVYSLKNASKSVTDAVAAYLDLLPPETPVATIVVTTRAVSQITQTYQIDNPQIVGQLMRLPADDLYVIKTTGMVQPGDEADAVDLRGDASKVIRALEAMQRERVSIAREAAVKLELRVHHDDTLGYVVVGFETEEQAIRWVMKGSR